MRRFLLSLSVAAALLAAGRAPAADVDPFLPADADAVISVNLDQIMQTPLGKKAIGPYLERQMAKDAQFSAFLKVSGLSPLSDFKRVTIAGNAAKQDEVFVVIHGKFN